MEGKEESPIASFGLEIRLIINAREGKSFYKIL